MGYRGKVAERQRARQLRADGWTLQRIADELGVSKGSVSTWVRDVPFTPSPRSPARRRGPNALQRRKAAQIEEGRAWGATAIGALSDRDVLIAGAALYAGEGGKRDGTVAFTNTDPRLVAMFCRWLRLVFDIDESRLRVRLYLHRDLDLAVATTHWTAVTGVPPEQFTAPYRAATGAAVRTGRHPMGCATVSYACARTHRAVVGLLMDALLDPVGGGGGSEGGT